MQNALVAIGAHRLEGMLVVPEDAKGVILFAHGSGSSRFSPRNTYVAKAFERRALGTLLFDLLSPEEAADRANVFDIALLAGRVLDAIGWAALNPRTAAAPIGLFGASTGAAAALVAAARAPQTVAAVVSRGGRPDLAGDALDRVRAPTLLIVGGADFGVIELNEGALARLSCEKKIEIVPDATHLFEEPGTLDAVIRHAGDWFAQSLARAKTAEGHQ